MLLTEKGKPDATSRSVLAVLAHHAHGDGSGARPSVLRIQYLSGYDERTVQRALRRLEDSKLIEPTGVTNGCVVYRLALSLRRPESDWSDLEAAKEKEREAAAARKRRSRARQVTDAESVTVTHSESVTDPDVTHSAPGRHALEVRDTPDVTHSESGRHALNAPRTVRNSPKEEESGEVWGGCGPDDASGGAAEPPDDEPEPEIVDAEIVGQDDPPPITAQSLVAEWLDHVPHRPPASVIGQTSRSLKQLLDERIDPHHVRLGLIAWTRKGLHPSALPSVVNEVMNRGAGPEPVAPKPKPPTRAEVLAAALARVKAEQQEATHAP